MPIIEHYRQLSLVAELDGNKTEEEVRVKEYNSSKRKKR